MNVIRFYSRKYLFLLVITSVVISCTNGDQAVQSPDSNIEIKFELTEEGQPTYSIWHQGAEVLGRSQLGMIREDIDFSRNMSLKSVSDPAEVTETYSLLHGKQKEITYEATEQTYHLQHQSGAPLDITFRVSDDGVAFRYHFPGTSEEIHHITEEKTSFNFPDNSRAWFEPLANVNTGFAETNPSYEEYYVQDVEVGTSAPDSAGWAYPALFKTGETWMLVSESGINGSYPATRLQPESPQGIYQVGFPQEGEQFPGKALGPQSALPWTTPWRIIAIGDLKTITESTLGTDLANDSQIADTSWIEPGSASWSWAKLKDESVNYEDQKRFIDYAADMGWKYTLVDVNWDQNIGYDKMVDLVDYADSKNVELFLWYNSSGSWNTTDFAPKSQLLTHEDRVEEFSRIREMGIAGIKVDFFAGDGQSMMQYYIDIFKDAADHNLLVNTHGTTLPRGWHRTWPNLMTMESVRGFEFITFEQENADKTANHNAMLPFTRNVFSPMDYTPMSLTELFNVERKTTSAHELALPVLFTSGVQHYAETARGMEKIPTYVKEFVKQIPVAWDEMHFIEGFPGEYVVIARRSGNKWFVAGINGEETPKEITADLSFIAEKFNGGMIKDGASQFTFSRKEVAPSDDLKITMKGNGGFVALFTQENKTNN
ncbi:alpha-glucosidase [Aliifodinibius salipaludis]|uniref:Alpha-glucosidase n=1 Tax=Fodinibius salipaludis TaxID=2032627 RepID=A0A2A2GG33_9BACT|nr:glycoside hydrolase family 97 protein [Aliifodinibius salipaludis]PAU95944.1 alpha-glucosidase [Aliifodinibius salipaludis]